MFSSTPTPPIRLTRSKISLEVRIQKRINQLQGKNDDYSPRKGKRDRRSLTRMSSSSPTKFGRQRMVRAKSGHFRRLSLEKSCLIARGEDVVFTPSVQDTPLLVLSEQQLIRCTTSSESSWEESFSMASSDRSFDQRPSNVSDCLGFNSFQSDLSLVHLESSPCKSAMSQIGTRSRSHSKASHSFSYEAKDEEVPNGDTFLTAIKTLQSGSPDVFRSRKSPRVTLQKYYALRREAETTVRESKKLWSDTPYSASELQDFQPPCDVETIQSILQDSVKNYQPLPSELRPHRRSSRFCSRMSPYAQARKSRLTSSQKTTLSQSSSRKSTSGAVPEANSLPDVLTHRTSFASPAPKSRETKPLTPFTGDKAKTFKEPNQCLSPLNMRSAPRPAPSVVMPPLPGQSPSKTRACISRMSSKQDVATSGLTKREQKNKENRETPKTPASSLRTNRPRPRYRTPTPCPKRRLAKK